MPTGIRDYPARAREIIRKDPLVRESVTGATIAFDEKRRRSYAEIDAEAWRRWAEGVKNHTLTHLDRYLTEAEARLEANGAEVHWAEDAAEAREIVMELAQRHSVRDVVKGKSMLTEEIDLNPALERARIDVLETDLGEFILQLFDEPPSHILGPAIHKSLQQVRNLFTEVLRTDSDADPDTLAQAAREALSDVFIRADMGITGANFLVAETGTVALIENEGNIRLATSLPRVHVAIVGIEKLLPRMTDLAGFLQLTARAATGQPIGCFVSLIQGPALHPEDDGPEEVPCDPGGQRAHRCAGARARVGGAAMLAVRRLPERLSGVSADRRSRIRIRLFRADRVGAGPRAAGTARSDAAALCVVALRSVLRRLPGEDSDPRAAPRVAARGAGGGAHAVEGEGGAGGGSRAWRRGLRLPLPGSRRKARAVAIGGRGRGMARSLPMLGGVGGGPGASEAEQAHLQGTVAGGDRMRGRERVAGQDRAGARKQTPGGG